MFWECRLLIADLVSTSLSLGMTEAELMKILTGKAGRIQELRKSGEMSIAMETRARRLLDLCKLLNDLCGDSSDRWLRAPNSVLGLRSPIQVLQDIPASLEGFLAMLRIYHTDYAGFTVN